jgi:hypothetical protein
VAGAGPRSHRSPHDSRGSLITPRIPHPTTANPRGPVRRPRPCRRTAPRESERRRSGPRC